MADMRISMNDCIFNQGLEYHLMDMAVQEKVGEVFGEGGSTPSIGVSNVLARLKLYYGDSYRLEVHSEENRGTSIKITIPKM